MSKLEKRGSRQEIEKGFGDAGIPSSVAMGGTDARRGGRGKKRSGSAP